MGVDIDTHGPLFDGSIGFVVRSYCNEVEREIADDGVNIVQNELDHVLQHPTGYYRSHIQTDRSRGHSEVNDGGVVYGPWLAGTGSRNSTTRFKGYNHWRRAVQRLNARASTKAEVILNRYIGRMGG